jgi:N-acetylglucosamine kinase-like BadF-type ATPase
MAERYFLGIDVGSSKTEALIASESGRGLGFGRAAGGNQQLVGYSGLAKALVTVYEQAARQAGEVETGFRAAQIAGVGIGAAGCDFPSDRASHLQAAASLGLSCPLEVVNDGLLGLLAGAQRGIGVNVTAGSGVNCLGRGPDGRTGRIVGNGMAFGEHGGASEIVQRGLQLVNYAWIQRIPPTALTRLYLEACGAASELDLMEGLSNGRYHLEPSLAVEVLAAAQAGDPAASDLARWTGEELGWLAVAVARQIGMQNQVVEIILSGSVFKAGEIIAGPMRAIVLAHCPQARLLRLDGPPVTGAVLLGMEQAGADGYAARGRLIETVKELAAQAGV